MTASANTTAKPSSTGKGRETRERVIRTAAKLFRRQGYDGTGLNEVLERSGAPRGSLYFHFPGGKEELAVAAVSEAGSGIGRGIEALLDSSDDIGEALQRVVDVQADDLERSDYRGGCPIAAVTLDAAGGSEEIRLACARAFDYWLDAIAARLRGAGWSEAAAHEQSLVILAGFEGALTLARARRDSEPLRALGRSLRNLRPS